MTLNQKYDEDEGSYRICKNGVKVTRRIKSAVLVTVQMNTEERFKESE